MAQGLNSFSFLSYNAGGDGDNVWPFVARDDKLHYDCSKLDQWEIVFSHAQRLGLHLHFKLQEAEIDDQRRQRERAAIVVPEALDGGATGAERKLYLREIIARFGHHLALNWNLGEENTQTPREQRAMAQFIADVDPYDHFRVIHSYPNEQELHRTDRGRAQRFHRRGLRGHTQRVGKLHRGGMRFTGRRSTCACLPIRVARRHISGWSTA